MESVVHNLQPAYYILLISAAENSSLIRMPKRVRRTRKQRGGNAGKVYIVYHIYCNQNTEDIVLEQISRILFSGLYQRVDEIRCYLTGDPTIIKKIRGWLENHGSKFHCIAEGPHDTSHERFTLLKIFDFVKPADRILYLHSKGVKHGKDEGVYWWRFWMEYFLVHKFEECLEALKTHDICGLLYTTNQIGPHFSGNFWWATGDYFLKLPRTIGPGYHDPESYIFKANPKYKELDAGRFNPFTVLYKTYAYSKLYVDSK
jgi:hypothetical protein